MVEGKVLGYEVTEIAPNGPFSGIGFQEGDIVVAVAGYETNAREVLWYLAEKLQERPSYSITVNRDGGQVHLEGRFFPPFD